VIVSSRQLAVVFALLAAAAGRAEVHDDRSAPIIPGAALLAGFSLGQEDSEGLVERGRALLRLALASYQRAGRHVDASRAAGYLSRVPRPEARFEDALAYANLAVEEATASGHDVALGNALTALAEVYGDIGMINEARDTFFRAEELLRDAPGRLAYTYMNHGIFLVDQESDEARRAGLAYLVTAREIVRWPSKVSAGIRDEVEFAVQLHAANAYADLGELAKAEAELVAKPLGEGQRRTMLLTRAFLAARADRLDEAVRLFAEADAAAYGLDTGWWIAIELARACRRAGRFADAEKQLRDAIAIVEGLRSDGLQLVRPFIVSRRAAAYTELIALLAEQQRGLDALVVAESLHARTWLDVVLGDGLDRLLSTPQGAREAILRHRRPAKPRDADQLLEALGAREALVILHAGNAAWRVHIDRQRVTIAPIAASDVEAIEAFRDRPGDAAAATQAARALLPDSLAARSDPLYIVADGEFADVPFAALPLGDKRLVQRRAVVRVPGLATLGCRPRPWSLAQLFLGDSTDDLPGAAAEVQRLGGSAALLGAQATRAAVLVAADFELLHIAVHGRATTTGGALQLADGLLTTTDVIDAAIGPRVVMLTGCATSASADAEAWTGFPSAFLASGSQHVIATLRAVDDAPAAAMIAAYYQQPETLSPPERLAAAQRAVAETLDVEVWSAFAAWGDADCGR
jgi:tetratricopeptide (TPR) repeat protein